MGDNIFSSRENLLQNEALQAYANSFNAKAQAEAKAQEKAQAKDEIIKGITEPIGGLLVGKPLEKVIAKAGRKALSKVGSRFIKDRVLSQLKNASNGDLSAFGKNLGSNAERNIKDVLSDEVPDRIKNAFSNLSEEAQTKINNVRERLGKSKIGEVDQPEPVDPEVNVSQAEPDDPQPVPQVEDDVPNPVSSDPNPASDIQTASDNQFSIHNFEPEPDTGADAEAGADVDPDLADLPSVNELFGYGREGAVLTGMGGGDDDPAQNPQAQQPQSDPTDTGQPNPNSTQQPDAPSDGDPSNAQDGNMDNSEPVDPDADPAPTAPESGAGASGDVASGLEDTADTLDALAGAEGGLDPIADVLAGIAGLVTLITGATTKSKPKPTQTELLTSGIQYGI